MNNDKYWIWLSRLNIETKVINDLLRKYKKPVKLWQLDKKELIKNKLSNENVLEILDKEKRRDLSKYIEYLDNHNIKMLNIYDNEYPDNLRNIYDTPPLIYIKGNKEILNNPSFAIIGCRDCSMYGKQVTQKIAGKLAKNGITIISGLARGIDTNAHIGTLKANGKTIAVVGTGLDIVYPNENKYLQEEIISQGGAIISEFVVGTKINKLNFPKRNRIISGISNGVLVVEAKEKSGSFITVDFALEQGKNVYAVPGNIISRNSVGTNNLIKQGAKIVTEIEDILEDFIEKNI